MCQINTGCQTKTAFEPSGTKEHQEQPVAAILDYDSTGRFMLRAATSLSQRLAVCQAEPRSTRKNLEQKVIVESEKTWALPTIAIVGRPNGKSTYLIGIVASGFNRRRCRGCDT